MGSGSKQGAGTRAAKELEARFQKWAKVITDKLSVFEGAVGEAGRQLKALGARLEVLEGRADDADKIHEGDGKRLGVLEARTEGWGNDLNLSDRVSKIEERLPAAPVKLATSVLVEAVGEALNGLKEEVGELSERVSAVEAEQIDAGLPPADEAAIKEMEDGPPEDDDLPRGEDAVRRAMPVIANAQLPLGGALPPPPPTLGEVVNHGGSHWVGAPGARGGSLGVRLTEVGPEEWRADVEPELVGGPGSSNVTRVQVTAETRQGAVEKAVAEATRTWPALFAAAPACPDAGAAAQEQLALHCEPAGVAEAQAVLGGSPPREVATDSSEPLPGGVRIVGGRVVES